MGRLSAELRKKAIELHCGGNSYSQINKALGIPKSTLFYWLSGHSTKRTPRNIYSSVECMNVKRVALMHIRHAQYEEQARKDFKNLVGNPLFVTGISLYWGEGRKVQNDYVGVINSDVEMIQLMRQFYVTVLNVPITKIRCALFIYPDIEGKEALAYWSEKVKIPSSQFIKTQVLDSRSTLTKRKTKYGMCCIYFSSAEFRIKIREWIRLLSENLRV